MWAPAIRLATRAGGWTLDGPPPQDGAVSLEAFLSALYGAACPPAEWMRRHDARRPFHAPAFEASGDPDPDDVALAEGLFSGWSDVGMTLHVVWSGDTST